MKLISFFYLLSCGLLEGSICVAQSEIFEKVVDGNTVIIVRPPLKQDQVFTYIDQMPEFKGNLNHYLAANMRYPQLAKDNNIEGRVIIKFVIDSSGKVKDVSLAKGIHPLLDNEALRIVKEMTDWKPGRKNSKPVSVLYTLPVSFRLSNGKH